MAGSTLSDDDRLNAVMKDVEKAEVAKTPEESIHEEEQDPNIVWWDGADDPHNPMNWSLTKKWINIGIISAITFIV